MVRKNRGNITRLTRSIFDTELYLGVRRRRLLDADDVARLDDGGCGCGCGCGGGGICRGAGGGLQVIQDICQCPGTAGSLSGIEIADNGITSIILSPFIAKLRLPRSRVLLLPSDTRSAVASLFNQNETQDKTTSRTQGPYTCIRKLPMCLCKWKYTKSIDTQSSALLAYTNGQRKLKERKREIADTIRMSLKEGSRSEKKRNDKISLRVAEQINLLNSQLPNCSGHLCVSIGKSSRFIGHPALIELFPTIPLSNLQKDRSNEIGKDKQDSWLHDVSFVRSESHFLRMSCHNWKKPKIQKYTIIIVVKNLPTPFAGNCLVFGTKCTPVLFIPYVVR
ncbi:hypothetical protein DBV15_02252 [Temnothorax longispinosus]|uniref:Uncharacterized protein n=1 Tax=Temnothorax longispinosus TaxID=300112 RepID=A0A4S2KTZ0_9HYME|nr:hypothetical protein DBV15_02252 [Temnothorax longispinosus]